MVSVPLLLPQVAAVVVTATAVAPLLLPIADAGAVKMHPFASVTATVWLPAARLLYTVVAVNALPSTE